MTPTAVGAAQAAGATILDVRPVPSFAAAHPTGALSIPLRPAFVSWLGWLAAHDRPIVVVREPDQDLDEVLWQAAKIGYENIVGELAGGIDAWTAASLPTTPTALTDATAGPGSACSTSDKTPSTGPGTSRARCTSSSATSRTPSTDSLTCPRW